MAVVKRIIAYRLGRFVLVGVANTALNFAVLNLAFYVLNQSKLVSSFIATSCAVIFSFFMNRGFVFVDKERAALKAVTFALVTGTGVLLLQNGLYAMCLALLDKSLTSDFLVINISNFIASLGVMLWNYNGYRIFVFNGVRRDNDITE